MLEYHLCEAACNGDVAAIRRSVRAGADPNRSNNYGWTPLRYASERGKADAIRVLLELGADIHRGERLANDLTYLHHAAMAGSADAVRVLLAAGSDPEARDRAGRTAFHCAAQSDRDEGAATFADTNICRIVTLLIEAGANLGAADDYGTTPLHRAAENAHAEMVRLLLKHGSDPRAFDRNGYTPLHYLAHNHSRRDSMAATVTALIEGGANADTLSHPQSLGRGATPLLLAASHAPVAVVNLLLAAGANPNFVDKAKRCPLTEALGNAENFAALLAAGADLSSLLQTKGKPGLLAAAEAGNAPAVQALLQANADPNKSYRGKHPLHAAVAKASPDAVAALLAAGAEHNVADKTGVTALEIARKRRRKAILPLLEAAELARTAKGQPT